MRNTEMVDKDLNDLHPDFKPKVIAWLEACNKDGPNIRITETWRDPMREDQLHAEHITNLSGSTCKHCFMIDGKPASKAVDFACYDPIGNYIKNGADQAYTQAGKIAENLGIIWGGRFKKSKPDWDHIEMKE